MKPKLLLRRCLPFAAVLAALALAGCAVLGNLAVQEAQPQATLYQFQLAGEEGQAPFEETRPQEETQPQPQGEGPASTQTPPEEAPTPSPQQASAAPIDADGSYFSKDEVALYIHTYGCLPGNFITKAQARELGWEGGGVERYAPGKAIGGDRFGNYEELLPEAKGRKWTECDVNYAGGYRGGERIVFSNDGLIYYSADHYENFELLYGKES